MHVIYVTGLGDTRKYGQRLAVLLLWRLYGFAPHFFESGWGNKAESFEDKLSRLLTLIDELTRKHQTVSIVGVSAGASLALHAYAVRTDKVHKVVCISGKIHHPEKMHSRIMEHNPAFKDSMYALPRSLSELSLADRRRIRSVYSDGDRTVPMEDSMIKDAEMELVGHKSHAPTIAYEISLGAWRNLRFLRSTRG